VVVLKHNTCNTKGNTLGLDNDPSAGSHTDTLLRLLLPLNDIFWTSSSTDSKTVAHQAYSTPPKSSINHSIGSSDGRCVQRAGTYSTRDNDSRLQGIPRSRAIVTKPYPYHEAYCKGYLMTSHQDGYRRVDDLLPDPRLTIVPYSLHASV
jgi:hypothetical protein